MAVEIRNWLPTRLFMVPNNVLQIFVEYANDNISTIQWKKLKVFILTVTHVHETRQSKSGKHRLTSSGLDIYSTTAIEGPRWWWLLKGVATQWYIHSSPKHPKVVGANKCFLLNHKVFRESWKLFRPIWRTNCSGYTPQAPQATMPISKTLGKILVFCLRILTVYPRYKTGKFNPLC